MKNIHCLVFVLDFKVTRNVTYHIKEYACKTCKKQLTTSSNGSLAELTPKFKEIINVLECIHHKPISKTNCQKINSGLLLFSH